jgi:hypothetical protein
MHIRRFFFLLAFSMLAGSVGCSVDSARVVDGARSVNTTSIVRSAAPVPKPRKVETPRPAPAAEQPRPTDADDNDDSHPSRWPKKLRAKYA